MFSYDQVVSNLLTLITNANGNFTCLGYSLRHYGNAVVSRGLGNRLLSHAITKHTKVGKHYV
jgi:hypothetical protein